MDVKESQQEERHSTHHVFKLLERPINGGILLLWFAKNSIHVLNRFFMIAIEEFGICRVGGICLSKLKFVSDKYFREYNTIVNHVFS